MLKNIKSWFTKSADSNTTTLNVSVEFINAELQYHLVSNLKEKIVSQITDHYLKENGEKLKKDIIQNPMFADALYNAILLREVERIRR